MLSIRYFTKIIAIIKNTTMPLLTALLNVMVNLLAMKIHLHVTNKNFTLIFKVQMKS
jgi:hypothetical protein